MKQKIFTLITSCLFVLNYSIEAQTLNCNNSEDTTHCYQYEKFRTFDIVIEKKWESKEITYTAQIPLLADMDGDCIPELIVHGSASQTYPRPMPDTARLWIINSITGKIKKQIDVLGYMISNTTPCLIDVNNDGIKEIIIPNRNHFPPYIYKLLCYDYDGKLLWYSSDFYYNSL